LGAGAVFLALDEFAEDLGEGVGGLARDVDPVIAKEGAGRLGQEEVEGFGVLGELAEGDAVDGIEELDVEVVDPEFLEIAENDVGAGAWGRCGSSSRKSGRSISRGFPCATSSR
jgi:hypothetical protein